MRKPRIKVFHIQQIGFTKSLPAPLDKPKEVVKSRLMKLDSSHIQYILECLKENSTQIRNIKQYLLATLYNAPVTVDSYYSAQVRHEFGWGSRVDKN